MQRFLIILGILLIIAGLLWPVIARLPFNRLPGDIVIDKEGFRVFIPLVTSLLLSLFLSLLFWLFRR